MLMTENDHIDWVTETDAARLLGVHVATLRRMRKRREGPVWYKIGHQFMYQRADVIQFIADRKGRQ